MKVEVRKAFKWQSSYKTMTTPVGVYDVPNQLPQTAYEQGVEAGAVDKPADKRAKKAKAEGGFLNKAVSGLDNK